MSIEQDPVAGQRTIGLIMWKVKSSLYKLFMRIIAKRNTKKLDFYRPIEQAGFRSGYSTNGHLQLMRILIEKCNEYNIDLLGRGVRRQGGGISPNLFTTILESVFKKVNWSGMGIDINGKFFNQLCFTDAIVLIAMNLNQLQH